MCINTHGLRQVLNQFGFVLVAASLVDTFLVRTLFVPALMFLAVDSNWWPGASVYGKDSAEPVERGVLPPSSLGALGPAKETQSCR
jgi:uncharacterized membrane protein YdfJ with MMPL/SSD domain